MTAFLCVGIRTDDELMNHAPRLKVISNYGVGYDNIDVEAATRRKIIVTNTPDVVTEATAELTFSLILAVTRRIAEADRILRSKVPFRWGPMQLVGFELVGKTLGIIGFGRIGEAVARRGQGFRHECNILSEDTADKVLTHPKAVLQTLGGIA